MIKEVTWSFNVFVGYHQHYLIIKLESLLKLLNSIDVSAEMFQIEIILSIQFNEYFNLFRVLLNVSTERNGLNMNKELCISLFKRFERFS